MMLSSARWRSATRASPLLRPRAMPRSSPHTRTQPRAAYGGSPRQNQYSRFNRLGYVSSLWKSSPAFRATLAVTSAGGIVFYVTHLETVPGSGRRRFNWVSPEWEKKLAEDGLRQVLAENKGKILPEWAPETRMVARVLERLIPNSGIHDREQWEIRVVKAEEPNAFVMPG